MYEGTRGSTHGERNDVAPAAAARGIETVAKFNRGPSQPDSLASVTGLPAPPGNEVQAVGVYSS